MARGWRLNPPPNWPTPPTDWVPDEDWRPDPGWGPAPVGWTLWTRESRTAWLLRHRPVNGAGGVALVVSGIAVMPLAALLAGLVGTGGPRPVPAGAAPVPEVAPTLGRTVPATAARHELPPVAAGPHDARDWKVEPAVRMPRRAPAVSRVRRVAPRPTSAPSQSAAGLSPNGPAGHAHEPSPTPAVTTCRTGGCGPGPRPTDPELPGDGAVAPPA